MSFSLGKQKLGSDLLNFEPLSCRSLKPKESIQCTVKLDAKESGVIQQRIPIHVKHSPCLMILAEATIIEPAIQISHDSLNFGEVMTGFRKV